MSFKIFKQRIKEKIGKAEKSEYPEGYIELRTQIDHTQDYLNKAIKNISNYCQKSEGITKVQTEVGQFLVDSGLQENDEMAETLLKIGEGLKSLATIHHSMLVNIVEKFIQPNMEYKKEIKHSNQTHKKYENKRLEYDAQCETVNKLKSKEKSDPQKIQQEEEKLTTLDNEKDEHFEESLEDTLNVLLKRKTKHLNQLNELLLSFHHYFAEGYTLTHDLKEPLEKLQEKANKKAQTYKQEMCEKIVNGSSSSSTNSANTSSANLSSPVVVKKQPEEDNNPVLLSPPTTTSSPVLSKGISGSTSSISSNKDTTKKATSEKVVATSTSSVTTTTSSKVIDTVKALYAYDAQDSNELSFNEGDVLVVYEKEEDDGWWKGAKEKTPNKIGIFPSNFVVPLNGGGDDSSGGKTVMAIYDYDATESNELTMKMNDSIEIMDGGEGGWLMGKNLRTGQVGLFPSNFTNMDQ
ncbi:hypothetical protein ABK040_003176 [Willaertia magna]